MATLVLGNHSFSTTPDVNGVLVLLNAGSTPSIQTGSTSSRPTPGVFGRLYVNTTDNILQHDTGTQWINLPDVSAFSTIINKSTASQTQTGTTAVDFFNYSVPGGTLGTNNMLRLLMGGIWNNTSGANRTVTITISYGSTIMWRGTSSNLATGNTVAWRCDVYLSAANSTSAQSLVGLINISNPTAPTNGVGAITNSTTAPFTSAAITGTAAINSNTANNFTVNFVQSGGGTTTVTKYFHLLERK